MKRVLAAMLMLAVPLSVHAGADVKKALSVLTRNDCLSCHAIASKVVGPAYRDVAQKYRGDRSPAARLVQKVRNGGSGAWGQISMPAHQDVPVEDLITVIDWILAGATFD